MRRVMMAVVGMVLTAGPVIAQHDDSQGRKLMTAATVTLAAYLGQGGTIDIQSADAALLERTGARARRDSDCIYTITGSANPQARLYTLNFRNLTGAYRGDGRQLVFYGGVHAPLCFKEAGGEGSCFRNLVIDGHAETDKVINDIMFALKNGCTPRDEDRPGSRDPY